VIVTNNHVSETRDYVLRKFTIRCTANQTTRPLYHMQYCSWPDHGSPEETESFLGFIDKVCAPGLHLGGRCAPAVKCIKQKLPHASCWCISMVEQPHPCTCLPCFIPMSVFPSLSLNLRVVD